MKTISIAMSIVMMVIAMVFMFLGEWNIVNTLMLLAVLLKLNSMD